MKKYFQHKRRTKKPLWRNLIYICFINRNDIHWNIRSYTWLHKQIEYILLVEFSSVQIFDYNICIKCFEIKNDNNNVSFSFNLFFFFFFSFLSLILLSLVIYFISQVFFINLCSFFRIFSQNVLKFYNMKTFDIILLWWYLDFIFIVVVSHLSDEYSCQLPFTTLAS